MTSDLASLQDIIEERYRVLKELRKLAEALGGSRTEEAEDKILKLLEKNRMLRTAMEENIKSLRKNSSSEVREYVETLLDYIRLVDMDGESELLDDLVKYAKSSTGPLNQNVSLLESELSRVQAYKKYFTRQSQAH